jgi:hypothetical protein
MLNKVREMEDYCKNMKFSNSQEKIQETNILFFQENKCSDTAKLLFNSIKISLKK